jgi:hypothetical protein
VLGDQGLTVLCCLLDASFVFWGIWAQSHQVKPGFAEALQLLEDLANPCSSTSSPNAKLTRRASPSSC